MPEELCQACGGPIATDASACPACGWAARGAMGGVDEGPDLWPDDEELALKVEEATAGEYLVQGLIGHGGMATVYLAREVALERPVAIKVMAPHVMRSYGMAERFKREARTAAALSHPNIIPIYAVRESGSLVCLVMKRLTGRSLDAILREHGALPLPIVQLVIRDIAAGLEFAHQHGVVHRDVKPANILVDQSGDVVVTDFGIAKAREADALTASGSTIGTPAYMSPEQAMGKRATAASDQYSLGAVAYELLTGRMPFIAETAMGLMYQHTHTPPEPLRNVLPDLAEEAALAVERMLAKSPDDRFPSLTDASGTLGLPASVGALDDPVRRELAKLASGGPEPKRRVSTPSGKGVRASGGRRPTPDPNATTMLWLHTGRRGRGRLFLAVAAGAAFVALAWALSGGTLFWLEGVTPTAAGLATDSAARRTTSRQSAVRPPARAATVPAAVERYRRAVESRDITQILAAYPAMDQEQVRTYREFFGTATAIRFEVVIKDLEQEDGQARMKLEGFLRYRVIRTGEEKITTYGTRARLVDGPTGWRILEIK
jgi:tRNA A-37 threonylcarbamoyl transferase component Bud32